MKEKLTLQDLIDLLAKKAGLTKKEADAFFREFFAVITDNIFNNEPVKIKDFGTFKLTKVSSRESVDVNTGAKIEIPAHYKLSFIPDKALKTLVNKPFEQFDTTLLEESVSFDSIEESEEPVSSSEDEDTSIDEPILSKPIEKIVSKNADVEVKRQLEDIDARIDNLNISQKEEESAPKVEKTTEVEVSVSVKQEEDVAPKTSFVYTYITDEEMSSGDNTTLTVVVPPGQQLRENTPKVPSVSDEERNLSLSVKEIEKEIMDLESPDADEETGEEVPLNINKVQEKIDQLKEAIDALAKVTWQGESPEDSLDTKLSVEEADVYNDELFKEDIALEELSPIETDEEQKLNKEVVSETVDSEESAIDDMSREKDDEDLLSALMGSDKETTLAQLDDDVDKIENIEDKELAEELQDDEEDIDYYGYTHDTFWTKFRKRIPIIIFLLIVIGLGVYHFAKLFEQKSDYQNYNPYRNLSGVDTIPNVDSEDESGVLPLYEDSITEYIQDLNQIQDELPSLNSEENQNLPLETETPVAETETVVEEADSIGKRISDKLRIRVLRKAAYMKGYESSVVDDAQADQTEIKSTNTPSGTESRSSVSTDAVSKFPINEAVIPGASLRSMSKRHYGSNIFWVYIYEENKSKLKNFDELSVGQVLTVPDLKKYNTGANDPKAAEKAKELERKIFSSARGR